VPLKTPIVGETLPLKPKSERLGSSREKTRGGTGGQAETVQKKKKERPLSSLSPWNAKEQTARADCRQNGKPGPGSGKDLVGNVKNTINDRWGKARELLHRNENAKKKYSAGKNVRRG